MSIPKYMGFDAIGDIGWAIIVTSLGYFLGSRIPNLSHYVDLVLALIILLMVLLVLYHLAKDPKIRLAVSRKFKR
jgi:membrane protein DedA with SNARE-associated domain